MLGKEAIRNAFMEGFMSVITTYFVPFFLWILIPGVATSILFKSKNAFSVGAFIGLIALFTIGPFAKYV